MKGELQELSKEKEQRPFPTSCGLINAPKRKKKLSSAAPAMDPLGPALECSAIQGGTANRTNTQN